MASGAVGINLQGNPGNCAGYTPLCAPDPGALAKGALHAQPDWYALLLTRSLVGYRPLPTTVTAEGASGPRRKMLTDENVNDGGEARKLIHSDEPTSSSRRSRVPATPCRSCSSTTNRRARARSRCA